MTARETAFKNLDWTYIKIQRYINVKSNEATNFQT